MLKTNWSHVVAQNPPPPPGQSSREISPFPRQWRIPQSKRPGRRRRLLSTWPLFWGREGDLKVNQTRMDGNEWMTAVHSWWSDCFIQMKGWLKIRESLRGFQGLLTDIFWNSNILKSSGCAMGHTSYCTSIDPRMSHIPSQTVWENFRNPNFHFGGIN